MDKETLSNYGWVVCVILVLAIMISLATPFGSVIRDKVTGTVENFKDNAEGVLDNMGGATSFDDLGGGGSGGSGGMGGGEPTPPSVEELQETHTFEYYSTLSAAVTDVNNAAIGENADANKENAVAGIYTESDDAYVVLLKDTTETARITANADMTINLGGHTLNFTGTLVGIDSKADNVQIDGRLQGSTIQHDVDSGNTLQVQTGTLTVNGGTYTRSSQGIYNLMYSKGNLFVKNAVVAVTATGNLSYPNSAISNVGNTLEVSNCNITVRNNLGTAYGIVHSGNALNVSGSSIKAYANYSADYSQSAVGLSVNSSAVTTIVNNCNITGVQSAVSVRGGDLYVNGGVYQGYGHGGFYFENTNNTSYVYGASIKQCAMPDGYTDLGTGTNEAGFYIGGGANYSNITVYMDNCDIYGAEQPIVLRGTSGEENNVLYISNSTINKDYTRCGVRIDSDTHKLYIGVGCNFTVDDTNLESVVTETDDVYIQE